MPVYLYDQVMYVTADWASKESFMCKLGGVVMTWLYYNKKYFIFILATYWYDYSICMHIYVIVITGNHGQLVYIGTCVFIDHDHMFSCLYLSCLYNQWAAVAIHKIVSYNCFLIVTKLLCTELEWWLQSLLILWPVAIITKWSNNRSLTFKFLSIQPAEVYLEYLNNTSLNIVM